MSAGIEEKRISYLYNQLENKAQKNSFFIRLMQLLMKFLS